MQRMLNDCFQVMLASRDIEPAARTLTELLCPQAPNQLPDCLLYSSNPAAGSTALDMQTCNSGEPLATLLLSMGHLLAASSPLSFIHSVLDAAAD